MFTLCCFHDAILTDQTGMSFFFFSSMKDCRGKEKKNFYFCSFNNIQLHCVLRWSCVDFRYDSTGESATDKPMGRTSSYTRRETRLAALNKQEQDSAAKDYKKVVSNHASDTNTLLPFH